MKKTDTLDIIIPVTVDIISAKLEDIVSDILEQHKNYGFTRFAIASPCGGWRGIGYPPKEHFISQAELFVKIRQALQEYKLEFGWWVTATLKSGHSDKFIPQVKSNGENHPFSNCPLDPGFRKIFSENIAMFSEIANPEFIIFEDDYSINAANGCYCKYHLEEFAKREGKNYSRQELLDIFRSNTDAGFELLRKWRELMKDSLVGLSECVRKELDKKTPEIPVGYMQAGGADIDGDCTLSVAKALAGENHTPFSRLYGTFYGGVEPKSIPFVLYHPLYTMQHITEEFRFYHESDTFPHMRYYTSGAHMRAIMSAAYSYGFDGSTFQTMSLKDKANEEDAYGKMFAKERVRFNKINGIAKKCQINGVQIDYDPFWNTADSSKTTAEPLWIRAISRFGIPYTSLKSDVAFLDERQTKYYDDKTILEYLSKGLFLDGDAAKALCQRGFAKYIGVEIGDDVTEGNMIGYDLMASEIIRDKFVPENKGKQMHSAHMYSGRGNGKLLNMRVIDEKCEVVTEFHAYRQGLICPAMTRFENSLGGKIVVMGITLDGNDSQSLFNYRRQRLIQSLISWCCDTYIYAKEAPEIYLIENKAVDNEAVGYRGMLTLINLCEDELEKIELHLPPHYQDTSFLILDKNGEWQKADVTKKEDNIIINEKISYLDPVYLLIV